MGMWRGGYVYQGSLDLIGQNRWIMAGRVDPRQRPYASRRGGPAPCGTRAAYKRHGRHGEPPCDVCREAEQLRLQDRREAKRRTA